VPRARSPATAIDEAPTAKMPIIAIASGCWSPSVMLPGSVKSDPEPMFSISCGNAPELARSRMTSLNWS
jgi:hypothetical protein